MRRLFIGKKIYTLDRDNPIVNSLLIENDVITWTGHTSQITDDILTNTTIYKLENTYIFPEFVDAHTHLSSLALSLKSVNLSNIRSISELIDTLKYELDKGDKDVIIGVGWDHENFKEKRMPTSEDLNKVSRSTRILIIRKCGHLGVVNKAFLNSLQKSYLKNYSNYIDLDKGLVKEEALNPLLQRIKMEVLNSKSLHEVLNLYVNEGITKLHWMNVSGYELKILSSTVRVNPLPIEVICFMNPELLPKIKELKEKYENENVKVMGIKVLLDGSLGARTAFLREYYSDDIGSRGVLLYSHEALAKLILKTVKAGLYIAIHVIGDGALETLIKAVKSIRYKIDTRKIRIEHLSMLPDDLLKELNDLSLTKVCIQPRFVDSDFWIKDRLGNRAKYCYRFKTLFNKGFTVAIGSDAPVEPFKISDNLISAIFGAYPNTNEKLNNYEAIKAYTIGGHSIIDELGGILKPGYPANFIGFNIDLIKAKNKETLKKLKVKLIVHKGKTILNSPLPS